MKGTEGPVGGDAKTDAVGGVHGLDGLDHLQQQTRAVLDGTSVLIGSGVGDTLQKLVNQVAVC